MEKFIENVLQIAKNNDIVVNLVDAEEVEYLGTEGILCAGYFKDNILACATRKPESEWFPIFIHESCHMDQFLQDKKWWKEINDLVDKMDPWLERTTELSQKELREVISAAISLELDCEKRTVAKIVECELNIDIDNYIRIANAYLFTYRFVESTRYWYGGQSAFYKREEIVELCPNYFLGDYETVPEEIMEKMMAIHSANVK